MIRVGYRPIGDYALISDCHSTALVDRSGSIDWACLGRFDAATSFGRLLDVGGGGHFRIGPARTETSTQRRYLPGTMVLETTFVSESGSARLTDAFAMREGGAQRPRDQLLRVLDGLEGEVEVDVVIEPRFDYGAVRPWLHPGPESGTWKVIGGAAGLAVGSDVALELDDRGDLLRGRVVLRAGQRRALTLVAAPAHRVEHARADPADVEERLDETIDWWRRWSGATRTSGPHAGHVERSTLVLKALTCAPTGAVIAAPTTSLPEVVGGTRNWDYRFSWVRDASMAIEALASVGHPEVGGGFRDFVMRSSAGHADELQILFGPYGERRLPELVVAMEGWRRSSPVRIGNAAAVSFQLDTYGHLVEAAHVWRRRDGSLSSEEWRFLTGVVDAAAQRWREPDAGIWEMRGEPRHFVHSKAMAWLAVDRGIDLAETFAFSHPAAGIDAWRVARDEIRASVLSDGVDEGGSHFVQHYGTSEVDASLLRLATVGIIDPLDDLMVGTVDAITAELGVSSSRLIRRYRTDEVDDGVGEAHGEGVFLLCSLWLVEVLALQGRVDEARVVLEEVLAVGNDVGLFAEEWDPRTGEMLGNFPQAYTHVGIITAVAAIRRHEPAGHTEPDDRS